MRYLKLTIVVVPMIAVVAVGFTACCLADFFIWIEARCQDWFESMKAQ